MLNASKEGVKINKQLRDLNHYFQIVYCVSYEWKK